MMVAGTVVCAGLCVALWFASPPAAPPPPAADAGCASGGAACVEPDPFCYQAPPVPGGVCTRTCPETTGCLDGWCCLDHLGAGDARYFVCAPPAACADPVLGERRVPR